MNRQSSRHAGFTLVELLVVMTIFLLLLSSVALALGSLFRAQGNLQDELVEANVMSRLAEQLRTDSHLATSAEVISEDEATVLKLLLPDAVTVTYRLQPTRIIRAANGNGGNEHRDVFRLLEGTTCECVVSAGSPEFVTLVAAYVPPELSSAVAKPRIHKVEASIGLHAGGVR